MNDLRSVSDRVLKLYILPLGTWGVGLMFLFAAGHTIWAITLCYPLALYFAVLTLWWYRHVGNRHKDGELSFKEMDAGTLSIGQILAGGAMAPAIVFLAVDPLAPSAWGTTASIGIMSAIAWFSVGLLVKVPNMWSNAIALLVAWIALPINATGALSIGFWAGLFEPFLDTLEAVQ